MPYSYEGLSVKDELNLALTMYNQKPAAIIEVSPMKLDVPDFNRIAECAEGFKTYLKSLRADFESDVGFRYFFANDGDVLCVPIVEFFVGKNKKSLRRLVKATTDEKKGQALGYPKEAIKAYNWTVGGTFLGGHYVNVALAKANDEGLDLPLWLAYISHVPSVLDIAAGNVCEPSEKLGKKYQDFIRTNSPSLAARVEKNFLERKLPVSWRVNEFGEYEVEY